MSAYMGWSVEPPYYALKHLQNPLIVDNALVSAVDQINSRAAINERSDITAH